VIGYYAGYNNADGYDNNFIGYQAGYNNTSGYYNNFVGYQAGYNTSSGYNNNFIGYQAGYNNTDGYRNTLIGDNSNVGSGSLYNATAIGYNAVVNTSNSLVLGNGSVNVGIGNSSPGYTLDVSGSINFTGTLYQNGSPFSGGGGLSDAPNDGNTYGRQNSSWVTVGSGSQGPEGPQGPQGNDGKYTSVSSPLYEVSYSQIGIYQSGSGADGYLSSSDWSNFNSKLDDAPNDGSTYARQNSSWVTVSGGGGGGEFTLSSGNIYSSDTGSQGAGSYNFVTGYQAFGAGSKVR
jgi:hypothetical protein